MQAIRRIVVLVLLLVPLPATLAAAVAAAQPTAHAAQTSSPCHQAERAGPDTGHEGDTGSAMACPAAGACVQQCVMRALLSAVSTTGARALDGPRTDAIGVRSVTFPPPHRPPLALLAWLQLQVACCRGRRLWFQLTSPREGSMFKQLLKLSSIATALVSGTLYATALPSGSVYSANEGDNSISEIQLGSGKVNTVKVPIVPHNVQIAPGGKTLLAVGMPAKEGGAHDMAGMSGSKPDDDDGDEERGKLLVLDTTRFGKIVMSLPVGKHPAHVVTDPKGSRAYVTNSEDNAITVVDLKTKRTVATVGTGAAPHGLRPSPDGRELYVANVQDNSVSVIDTARLAEVARIPVGRAPVQVGFTPDGKQAYVSLRDDDQVAVIDTVTRQVVGRVGVGRKPIQVFATPDGRQVYVANQGTEAEPDNRVSVIDTLSRSVRSTVTTGAGAHGVVASNDGAAVFITNIGAGTVSAIDTGTQQVVATYRVGAGPNGISYRVTQ